MKPGFTFNDVHSSYYGVTMRSRNRSMLPRKEAKQVKVPGQEGYYDLGNNTYDNKFIVVDCFLSQSNLEDLRSAAREIAAWLSVESALVFDDETDKIYTGSLKNEVSFENIINTGFFTLMFEVSPFQSGDDVTVTEQLTEAGNIELNYQGTAPACVRITITNNGANTINGFTLTYGKIS